MKLPRRRPRYADIVATLALAFALGGTAYAVTQIDPDSVYTDAIQDQAVTAAKLHTNSVNSARVVDGSITSLDIADESVGAAELGPDAVTGANVAKNSISLDDLVGASVKGAISFNLGANACGTLSFGVSGAHVGEVVAMGYTGSVAMPDGVVFAPGRVTAAGVVSQRACNLSSSPVSVSSIGVHIITFG